MVFTVSCPECNAEFPVDSAKVPEGGILAQCSMCPGTFLVENPETEGEAANPRGDAPWGAAEDAEETAAEFQADAEFQAEADAEEGEPLHATPAFAQAESAEDESGTVGEPASDSQTAVASRPGFGQSDPDARAARLARVLVSDMMTYNPALYEKAMEAGTLAEDFEDEVKKSWSEYVDQVGEDVARSTPHFTRALNDILAKGDEIFQESMYE
ncbi:MAG: zinc-ribbon domain-containing protein [Gemmatimonadota bacterium]|nr:zinc-ribbon domain-containing protein [Gemmatimonadota bacterium]